MRKIQQFGRRTFLMGMGKGSFALLTEMTFGFGRRGLAVALGGSGLATACTQPQLLQPTTGTSGSMVEASPEEAAAQWTQVSLGFVNAYVLIRGNEAAIVDSGTPGSLGQFADVITSAGLEWSNLNHLILTHHHGDHVGSVDEIMGVAASATLHAGEDDIPSIIAASPIQALSDGDEIFGMQVVATPGHTPGHISLFDPIGSLMIAGDAIVNSEDFFGASEQYSLDMALANESIKKLSSFEYETMVFGHGTTIESGASGVVAEAAAKL